MRESSKGVRPSFQRGEKKLCSWETFVNGVKININRPLGCCLKIWYDDFCMNVWKEFYYKLSSLLISPKHLCLVTVKMSWLFGKAMHSNVRDLLDKDCKVTEGQTERIDKKLNMTDWKWFIKKTERKNKY